MDGLRFDVDRFLLSDPAEMVLQRIKGDAAEIEALAAAERAAAERAAAVPALGLFMRLMLFRAHGPNVAVAPVMLSIAVCLVSCRNATLARILASTCFII